ncbi:response regulator [Candidatus Shapirobacteria bacterium]|nr:response regulator [Candidatus Shapirobacteria bacterium]
MTVPAKILIIEDDQLLTNALGIHFLQSNFEVKTAANMKETLSTLKSWLPDLIILDIILPIYSGFDILKSIKSNPDFKSIPVIIASNLSDEKSIQTGKELGAIDYIVKNDLSLQDLTSLIQKVLNV